MGELKTPVILLLIVLTLAGTVSSMSANYYYHPQCGHCQSIAPFIQNIIDKYENVKFNVLDVSKGSYGVSATPTLELKTKDGREITMLGSDEITKNLKCELDEKSNLNCPTYSANECRNDSWFIKE